MCILVKNVYLTPCTNSKYKTRYHCTLKYIALRYLHPLIRHHQEAYHYELCMKNENMFVLQRKHFISSSIKKQKHKLQL